MEYPRNVHITKGTVNGPFFCSRLSYLKLGLVPTKKQRVLAKSVAIVYQAKSKERNKPNFKYFVSRIFTSELRRLSLKRDRKQRAKSRV